MDEEIKKLAKEILTELKPEIAETTKQCVGDECKKIRAEYEERSKPKPKDKLDEVTERLQAIEELFSADDEEPIDDVAPAKKGRKASRSHVEEVDVVESDCPNCGYDKTGKPKYCGHCSEEGDSVKFSKYEKDTDWKYCPHCASEIEWDEEDEE